MLLLSQSLPALKCSLKSQVKNLTTLQGYYQAAYAAVRASCAGCFVMLAPRTSEQDSAPKDSPTPTSWLTFMSNSSYTRVLLDLHKCAPSCTHAGGAFGSPWCAGGVGKPRQTYRRAKSQIGLIAPAAAPQRDASPLPKVTPFDSRTAFMPAWAQLRAPWSAAFAYQTIWSQQ